MKNVKQSYLPPVIEVIVVENEAGVMMGSDQPPGYEDKGSAFSLGTSSARTSNGRYTTSAFGEVEDLLNDILTVKK